VIPLHDNNPLHRTPVLTIGLIVANVVVYFGLQLLQIDVDGIGLRPSGGELDSQQAVVCEYGLVPAHLVGGSNADAESTGALATCLGVNQEQPRFLGLFTSQFLHGDIWHLAFNMLFLWVFGNNIEDRLGRIRFLPFYLTCGAVAGLIQAISDPSSDIPVIGASGAISGILGAYLVLYPRVWVWTIVLPFFFLPFKIPAWIWLGIYFALQFFFLGESATSGGGGIAFFAHIGGFIAGMVLIKPFLVGRPPPAPPAPAIPSY
jgi:membrane associated rhomboid family serine protease